MMGIRNAATNIQNAVTDVLFREYQLSEGKFCVLVVLHQNTEGISPSVLADKVGVARATVSAMLMRLTRDDMVTVTTDTVDGRGKKVALTPKGRAFMDDLLPAHYLRITKIMGKLTETEQKELFRLLAKLGTDTKPN